MQKLGDITNRVVNEALNQSIENEVNRIASRHIGRLLARLQENYTLNNDMCEAIKAQFRMMQGDVIELYKEMQNVRERI